jgi:hypothetical protein
MNRFTDLRRRDEPAPAFGEDAPRGWRSEAFAEDLDDLLPAPAAPERVAGPPGTPGLHAVMAALMPTAA